MKRFIFCLSLWLTSQTLDAESALQQLYDAGGSPPEVPMPQLKTQPYNSGTSSTSSSSTPRSTSPKPSRAPSPAATVGATVFGALLESVLFDTPSNAPDPETLRQQEEEQRQAQEAAKKQEQEAQKQHQNLMHSFKSVPVATTTTETTSPSSGLSFKSAQTLKETKIDTSSNEAMRESASRPFDGGTSHMALPSTWKPYPLGKTSVSFSKPSVLCQNKACTWPKATPLNTTLPKATVRHTPINLAQIGVPTAPNPSTLLKTILASKEQDTTQFYVILNRLSYFGKEIGKELLTSIAMKLLESTPAGEKIALMKEVHDLATNDMEDANKVALWLGSTNIDQPPEITSLTDDAKPFLIRGISAQDSFEKLGELISDTNDVFDMSAKFSDIIKNMP